jgi:hypothetical protein
MGLGAFADAFASEGFDDPQYWNELGHDELRALGLKTGHLRKWDRFYGGNAVTDKMTEHRGLDSEDGDSVAMGNGVGDEEKDSVEDGREKFDFGSLISMAAPLVSSAVSAMTKDLDVGDEQNDHEKFILPLISTVAPLVIQAVAQLIPHKKGVADHDVDAFVENAVQSKDLSSAMMTLLDVAAAALPAVQGALHGQHPNSKFSGGGRFHFNTKGMGGDAHSGREKFDFSSLISQAAPLVAQAVTALTKDMDAQKALNGAESDDEEVGHEKFIIPLITTVAPLVLQAVTALIPKKKGAPSYGGGAQGGYQANSKFSGGAGFRFNTKGAMGGDAHFRGPAQLPPINIYYGCAPPAMSE